MPPEIEYPAIFHASERETAKAAASGITLEYIERLEEVARAAFALWKSAPLDPFTDYMTEACSNAYVALVSIDCMDEY